MLTLEEALYSANCQESSFLDSTTEHSDSVLAWYLGQFRESYFPDLALCQAGLNLE